MFTLELFELIIIHVNSRIHSNIRNCIIASEFKRIPRFISHLYLIKLSPTEFFITFLRSRYKSISETDPDKLRPLRFWKIIRTRVRVYVIALPS